MIKIALAGNIASGKSLVQNILEAKGYKVLDTDIVGHNVLTYDEVKTAFKEYDVFDDFGNISREKLGKLVFANSGLKIKLENISHPIIAEEIKRFFEENKNEKLLFVAIPLVFEAKMEYLFDKILFIYTDDNIRRNRLKDFRGYSDEYADVRMRGQISQDLKKSMADYVIFNNKGKKDLELEVDKFLKSF